MAYATSPNTQLHHRHRRCNNHNSSSETLSGFKSLQTRTCVLDPCLAGMSLSKKIYVGTERCGLCRLQLRWGDVSDLNAWDLDFRAAFCLEPNDENTIEITSTANLSRIHDQQIDVRLTGRRPYQSITICHYQQRFRTKATNPIAYCFHDWCYEILIQKVKSCTESEIYKLSQILSLDSVVWASRNMHRHQIEPTSNQTLRDLADSHRPLSKLLRLPVELRNIIWKYIGLKAAFSATVLVAEETTRLLHALNCSGCQTVSLTQGSRISVKMFTVFGISYIQSLADGQCSEVIPGVVVNLTFAMVYGGICAIKLCGRNWDTGWLGVLPSTGFIWYGSIQKPGNTLICSSNGLYFTSVSSSRSSLDDEILWEHPDIPKSLSNPDQALFDFNRDIVYSSRPPKTRQPRCFGYLPLLIDNEYANGLTVYLTGNGTVGLESHFTHTSRLLGSRDGCSKHFLFDSGERIAFTWLRIANSQSFALAQPIVTIQTTLGRIYTFGPYILPQLVMGNQYRWVLLNKLGSITGLYLEIPRSSVILRIGITRGRTLEYTGRPNLEYPACSAPRLPRVGPNAGLFLSVAVLSNLRKVELCRIGSRCTGLRLYYLQSPPSVLGQWYTTHLSQHVPIYIGNGLNTRGIRFKFLKSSVHQVVTDISFVAGKSDDDNSSYFGIGETITWWFSKFDDVICHWDGKFLPVAKESITNLK